MDLFVPHRDGGQSIFLWNDGKGDFPASTKIGPADTWARIGPAGDFDGDGRLDLAIVEEQKKAAFLIGNRGRRQFAEPVRLPGPPWHACRKETMPYSLGVAGLNRDGHPDIDRDGWRDIVAVRSDAPNGIWFGAPAI
ncbi:MAG: VCBS repeat-containing protein [Acidobacteria bacterium]|nr:VCBS repeat-containing protein [Acidobacteriota bacterium]